MPNVNLGFRIEGARDARGKVRIFGPRALEAIRAAADQRAKQSVFRFQTEMAREYTSQWATGMLARGISYKATISGNGVDVKFFIQDRKELRYVTALLGGHFQEFPVGPFVIRPVEGKALVIPLPGGRARRFIRGAKGQFAGSRQGSSIIVKQVLWGRKTGGFSRDVLSEVAEEEAVLFVQDLQAAVKNVIVSTTGG